MELLECSPASRTGRTDSSVLSKAGWWQWDFRCWQLPLQHPVSLHHLCCPVSGGLILPGDCDRGACAGLGTGPRSWTALPWLSGSREQSLSGPQTAHCLHNMLSCRAVGRDGSGWHRRAGCRHHLKGHRSMGDTPQASTWETPPQAPFLSQDRKL